MTGKKVNRLIVPNVYTANGVEPVTSVNNILPVNGNVTIPIPTVPTNVSAFTNDAGYLTSATLDEYATQSWVQQQGYLTSVPSQYITDTELSITLADYVTSTNLTTILDDYATKQWVNNQGYITGITSSDVTNALGFTPYNSTNPDGFITSADLPTNYVTTNTAQDVSGRKTFLGEKAIYFKQIATSNKLGFTLYNPSNTELGALEYRPSTIGSASLLALNCPQTTGGYVGFRYWGTPAVNIVAPKVPTAGNYYIPTHITNGSTTVTASNTGSVDISSLLPDVSGYVTNTSLATTLADYQPLLVSGTNIKTVNGMNLLGSGNINVLQNTATGSSSLTISGTATSGFHATNIGYGSTASGYFPTALGSDAEASGTQTTALGYNATASANYAIQIGSGTNSTASTLAIGFNGTNWQLLDGTTGLIPDARLSSNIARTSQIPSISNLADKDLSNLSTTGQAIIDGKADTTLSNVSSIDSSSAVATELNGKVNNDDYYYKSGDTDSYTWYGGGYITSGGTEIWFTLPTPKSIANVTTVTCTALTTAFRKSNGGYMPSSGGNMWNALANATVTISKQTENALSVNVKYNKWGGTNNTPVGVLASISLSFT